jgi:hypothetical protein
VPRGILLVETHALPGEVEAYHRWYDEVHLREFVDAIDGIVSARRFDPQHDGDPFVTVYEIEADDLDGVRAAMGEWGRHRTSAAVGLDPGKPTRSRFYELRTTYPEPLA